eukprot:scaffold289_cov162-Chaetoceros_neogracile.AAC.2
MILQLTDKIDPCLSTPCSESSHIVLKFSNLLSASSSVSLMPSVSTTTSQEIVLVTSTTSSSSMESAKSSRVSSIVSTLLCAGDICNIVLSNIDIERIKDRVSFIVYRVLLSAVSFNSLIPKIAN